MTLEQKPAKGTSLTEALTVDRHASSAKFLRSYKRVKTVQTALSRILAAHTGRGNELRDRPAHVRISAKSTAELTSRPGKASPAVGRSSSPPQAAHDRAREPGSKASRPRNPYHGRPSADRKHVPSGQVSSAKSSSVRPRGRPRTSGHDRSTDDGRHDRCPADRPDRPSERRGRPEARFEARFTFSSPA
ncbi:unnamed protein product [Microthlaspi erraticum]|uniref:Uncharacterized protein n=1 Tax=Microthlaspi erraticum TaxID=1685480 RepID=A0A6D2J3M1_9BRAS|nr:unnamed protein product [Microthlaspi erraticum]